MHTLSDIAGIICKKYPFKDTDEKERMENRKHDVQTYFNLDLNSCLFSYSGVALVNNTNTTVVIHESKTTTNELTTTSRAFIIVSVVLIILLFILGVTWLIYRRRRRKTMTLYHEGQFINRSKSITSTSLTLQSVNTTILINIRTDKQNELTVWPYGSARGWFHLNEKTNKKNWLFDHVEVLHPWLVSPKQTNGKNKETAWPYKCYIRGCFDQNKQTDKTNRLFAHEK